MSRDKVILLLTGYKRTGKDYFGNKLSLQNYKTASLMSDPEHHVYINNSYLNKINREVETKIYVPTIFEVSAYPIQLGSFASKLRDQTRQKLSMLPNGFDLEKMKDCCVVNQKTIREHMKGIATQTKKTNEAFYAEHLWTTLAGSIEKSFEPQSTISKAFEPQSTIVTDWRFHIELQTFEKQKSPIFNIETARIYSKDSVIPPTTDMSEHELDHVSTDYLILKKGTSLLDATKQFNQYSENYVFYTSI